MDAAVSLREHGGRIRLLNDIDRDFAVLNAAWEAWVPADAVPARATCEAKLAAPNCLSKSS